MESLEKGKHEDRSCLIVNLYSQNEGYSISLKLPSGVVTETIKLSYDEDDEFISYLG